MTKPADTSHALYRFFDDHGALLYVGITNNPGRRWARHETDRPWWHEVHHVELERHPDRGAVLDAERKAIREEKPRYNVVHVQREPVLPTQAVVALPDLTPPRCEEEGCGAPAEYLEMSYRELAEYERADKEWNAQRIARITAEAHAKGYEPTGIELNMWSGTDLFDMPTGIDWHSRCEEHVIDNGTYGFSYPRTWEAWVHITAHLLESKGWLPQTDWHAVLYAAQARNPAGRVDPRNDPTLPQGGPLELSGHRQPPCPACGKPSGYVSDLDRYSHMDGSENRACWLAATRGEA